MRVSLIKNGKIYNTNLPLKINGSFWIEDKDKNNLKRNLINIEAKDGKWQLKSNFETKIVSEGKVVEDLFIEEYSCYELQVKGEKFNYILCTSPVYDKESNEFEVGNNVEIYIGNAATNTINYNNSYVSKQQCLIKSENGIWSVKNLTNSGVVFVNGNVVTQSNLSIGDVVSIMNLKIIICGTYIIMNNPKGIVNYNTQLLRKRESLNINNVNEEIEKEEDTELKVYSKSEYFFRMPRFRTSFDEEEVYIDAPPEQEKEDEMPLAYTLGPMITMGITSMVSGVTAVGNVMSGTQSLSSALPSLVTCGAMLLSMMVWPFLQKRYATSQKKREKNIE